jgi:two-component system, OmpR family, alkaline phosphatase synthesis response regulator PhoP
MPTGLGALRYKVLLVDDDDDVRQVFAQLLKNDGLSVVTASNVVDAFAAAVDSRPDVVLTDVAMPESGGRELCRQLKSDRRTAGIPIIMMSGIHKGAQDQLEGLELGADDYLAKSTPPRLLAAKIRALLRRFSSPKDLDAVLRAQKLELDVQARTVTYRGRRVDLTRKEFDLLTIFLRKPGQVLSTNYLLESVWGYDPAAYNDPRTVQTHLSSLRRKLAGTVADRLTTVPGLGYRLEAE